ncbi:diguanylate cyclase domain-containing protein [Desulfosarcina ovata]|nr:diguanylate cyclase [Desulfosarcina ovata]
MRRTIVGRAPEIDILRAALDDAMAGRCRGLLIGGAPGVGKTALINELRPLITAAGGWFVSGKSDQYRQDAASNALCQALRGVGRLLLAEPENELMALRPRLLEALDANAGLIAAMVPEMATVLGVPAEADDDPVRVQARLQQAALSMLRALARAELPIVVVLDDLQWAGSILMGFMDAVIADHGLHGILLVGAYRDNEVDATHPLSAVLQRWQSLEDGPRYVRLTNLPAADLGTLLGDMLRITGPAAAALADAIHPHSGGNPFDTVEFVNALRREGVLTLEDDGWTWDAAAIRQHIDLGDVVTLLTQRILALPEPSQDILRLMACLGGDVELSLLQAAAGTGPIETDASAARVEAALTPALEDGLLVMEQGGTVRFRHDRIQQATYGGLTPSDRRVRHLAVARQLADVPGFRVVAAEQYLAALALLTDPAERIRAALLFRQAAGHARRLANYALTERFLAAAIDLVEDTDASQSERARLRVELTVERHAALLGLSRFEELDRLWEIIEAICDDPLLRAEAASAQMMSLMNRARPEEATELGLSVLAELGHPAPAAGDLLPEIEHGLDALRDWVSSGSVEEDVRRGPNPNPRTKAVAKIIDKLVPPAFFAGAPVMPWIVTSAAQLWAHGGPLPGLVTPLSHASFVTVALRSDYRTGFATVSRVLAVGKALGFEPQASTARMLYGLSAGHWFEPLEKCLRTLRRGFEGLVRGGEMMYSGLSFYGSIWEALEWGPTLDDALAEIETGEAFTERTGNSLVRAFIHSVRQAVQALQGRTNAPGAFSDGSFDDAAYRATLDANPAALAQYHLMHAIVADVFCDRTALAEHAGSAIALLPVYESSIASLWGRLVKGLALSGQVAAAAPQARKDLLNEFDQYRAWMAARTVEAPANFAHLLALLDAERATAIGDVEAAIRAYDSARHEIEHRQRPWHRAIIAERSGRFYLAQNIEHAGRAALREARQFYLAWGAIGKVDHLELEFPFLKAQTAKSFGSTQRGTWSTIGSNSSSDLSADSVDILAILRASQSLSSETSLARLQVRVADLLCGLTGATSARMLLRDPNQGSWYLPHHKGHEHLSITQETAPGRVPLSVVRYVERTHQPLLVDDATRDDRFAHDPYLAPLDNCALLVVPLQTRDEINALLLLENRHSRAAFGTNRLDTVRLIAGQLSVSLDNAMLYTKLERKVAERTQALQAANDQLELLAVTDALTGLSNRRHLTETLDMEWRRAIRPGTSLAVAMIDIDEFKCYNDHYGHQSGDDCLREVAAAMQRTVRDTDLAARYGGEEFTIVLPKTDLTTAHGVAERIRTTIAALAEPHVKAKHRIVTISIGVAATVPTPTTTAEQLLKAADNALYEAKRTGRNRVVAAANIILASVGVCGSKLPR